MIDKEKTFQDLTDLIKKDTSDECHDGTVAIGMGTFDPKIINSSYTAALTACEELK